MIRIINKKEWTVKELKQRVLEPNPDVTAAVAEIIRNVRENGDRALSEYAEKFDRFCPAAFEVSKEEIQKALASISQELKEVLTEAAQRIERYHKAQVKQSFTIEGRGTMLMQKVRPLEKVGIYVPGGTAAYPSTVLMNAIPAKIAGVNEIIMVSPPTCNGKISPVILAAAAIAGVDRVFQTGGAQAVAALAYGTESIPKVSKICGPGNAFVAEAKRQVFGPVGIDMVAGPSEILVIADEKSDPAIVAADMLSQAEHDRNASAMLVTTSAALADAVAKELEIQLETLPRREIAEASVNNNGFIMLADTIEEAIALANEIAPEHLELCVDNPFDYIDLVKNAGSVFLGRNCPEALGDYFAGTNHTLPTGGTAVYASPLSVDDFVKKTSFTYYTIDALNKVSDSIALFARQEQLEAHARSALSRKKQM